MKTFTLIFYLFLLLMSASSMADEVTSNAEGDTIVILDHLSSQNTDPNRQVQSWQTQSWQNGNWQTKAQEILMNAMSLTGIKYKYGGKTPQSGFDCSGFVSYVFSQAANISLPPTARAISQIGQTIKKEDLQPGDLVFFNTLKSAFSHVGIYIGNNQFIHAPRAGTTVRIEDMRNSYWIKRYNGAQRLDQETKSTN